jgi:hypothetical protein
MPNWIVVGTDIETGETQSLVIEGMSRAHAEVLALKRGMRVESVEPDQLCPGDDSRLGAINFVDPTEPLEPRQSGALPGDLELDQTPFLLPAWFTWQRCRQAKILGLVMLVMGAAAYFAHRPHELYALEAAVGLLLATGAWAAQKFRMIRVIPVAQAE